MKLKWGFAGAALLIVSAATYYCVHGKEYVYAISEQVLQEKLAASFPVTKSYLIIQVTLDHPRVSLKDGSDRIDAGIDAVVNIRVGQQATPLGGSLDVSSGIRYVSESGEFFLTDPIIRRFAVQGVPNRHANAVNEIMTKALTDYYAAHPVYTLPAIDAKHLAIRLALKRVIVKNRQLIVTLGI
jgi:hypothetical protein